MNWLVRGFLAFLLAVAVPVPPGPAGSAAAAAEPPAVTVVMDDNYPPYVFRDADGNLQGILKDLWDLWSRP